MGGSEEAGHGRRSYLGTAGSEICLNLREISLWIDGSGAERLGLAPDSARDMDPLPT